MIILQSGAICLHAAAMKGHTNVVRALLQKGATPDSKTKVIQSILYMLNIIFMLILLKRFYGKSKNI